MTENALPEDLAGCRIHLVGAKGTGMTAFAEILSHFGALLTGSDVPDVFYTDAILDSLGVKVASFSPGNIAPGLDLVIHSAAYDPNRHPELVESERLGIPVLSYTEALGAFSARFDSSGIAGVHGKTTTTALTGAMLKEIGAPAIVLAGSAVSSFGDRSTMIAGELYFVAETCEYRRHFLSFHPRRIVLTSVEPDHQDFFPTYESIRDAFVEYACRLPPGGELIHCSDDPGAVETAGLAMRLRPDLLLVPYGLTATGPYRIVECSARDGKVSFRLSGFEDSFSLRVPGRHTVLDAAAALALALSIERDRTGNPVPAKATLVKAACALEAFRGSRRRSEIILDSRGILIVDDYAHHPTAIRTTLAGFREFYRGRRLIVDFMSHTYSRTKALLDQFAESFGDADEVILHKIYPSARESPDGSVSGRTLFEAASRKHGNVRYFEEPMDALDHLLADLKPGDVFVTMGAGDNFKLGRAVADALAAGGETAEP
ncbi:MAG: UDP-N-acetylmuramate--L-alanine ligase [Spirochaetes bacterium]|nr:UDP-N-acetylmuramate--L-alanine ligase [Spirochaetota bacterium]